jgi:hypothetical protein
MTMAEVFRGMLVGSSDVFQLALNGKAKKYVFGNILILGILFGISNLFVELQTTPDLPLSDKFAIITPLIFSFAGIVTMCGALIALTLVYWAAAIAFGGQGGFGVIAALIGVAATPFWVLAPLLNYTIRNSTPESNQLLSYIFIALAFFWSFKLIRQSFITGQGLSMTRATIAVAAVWIFSVSSIYVFLP